MMTCNQCGTTSPGAAMHDAHDCITTLRARLREVEAERDAAVDLVRDAVKYVVEDRAVTPRATRLERWVERARAYLASSPPVDEARVRTAVCKTCGHNAAAHLLFNGDRYECQRLDCGCKQYQGETT